MKPIKKLLISGAFAATIAALSGCSLKGDKTVFLQCVDQPSNLVLELKMKDKKISFRYPADQWKDGSDVKFGKSVIIFRDYMYAPNKTEYTEYTINRLTGLLYTSGSRFYSGGLNAKCSVIDEEKLKF
jgi:hypothetical protein